MDIKKWFKNQVTALSIAISNVEKNTLGQDTKDGNDDATKQVQKHSQGTLADALTRDEITQDVRNLRWRTYKVLKASDGISLEYDSTDENDNVFYVAKKKDKKTLLKKIIIDTHDDYQLEMVVPNEEISLGNMDAMNDHLKQFDAPIKSINENGDTVATHGEITSTEYFASVKAEKPIQIKRSFFPKFFIENYTKKLNIRTISDTEKLLEFYVSKYPDEYNLNSKMFIREIRGILDNQKSNSNILEISEVEFVSYNTIGSEDFYHYVYKILSFDKIIEFDGYYVIKFKAEVIVNGEDILQEFVEDELEEKYKNKVIKNRTI